mmetsp:Transcript_8888/g.19961  ORF Transcript_8888/g.19961 Transcript_8888/m.19961 type:complete len:435 (+) Transcript_8888:198-1502(+)|eukprot:CAMPEP_0172312272 /NCGR_PEP_ID=MMETSP1058-20130122/17099_1 /TAXON_ID=83371 /ORGANISM="Detonula confervacea, Strain CCMP 353" /LENGTH=434 /DNA_ID=CAMNT_0013025681 /DNA_START=154 /DNA_END=1458 /DNA_ORIENTATION=+
MKIDRLLLHVAATTILAKSAFSFSYQAPNSLPNLSPTIDGRDVYTMADWAANCGVQQAEGVQLTSYDGNDYFSMTQADIPAGSCVMYVPSDLVFTSTNAAREFGDSLYQCESRLVAASLQDKVPLFRIFFKILAEYEKGEQSAWFPWLDSLPRTFNTGASMTYDCFDCLPPYAAYCAFAERHNLVNFEKIVRPLGGPSLAPFDPKILDDSCVLKWAYNVALTRSIEKNGERFLAPMIDMFNHGAETEVDVSYDENTGECYAYSSKDIPAGSPLRISYVEDPTDSTPLFAQYGFLDESSPGTFCKVMHMLKEMDELGYQFSNLLFYKNGEISPEVYDVVLYHVLKKNDPNVAQGFCQAVVGGDEATKGQYIEQYWPYLKEELQSHVDGLLGDLDRWSATANSYDLNTHPRVPMILQHNAFVKGTFLAVKANLDNM